MLGDDGTIYAVGQDLVMAFTPTGESKWKYATANLRSLTFAVSLAPDLQGMGLCREMAESFVLHQGCRLLNFLSSMQKMAQSYRMSPFLMMMPHLKQ
jgi:hypothetical protein